jgi:hypothetical protein
MGQVPIAINFSLVYTQCSITWINAVCYFLYNTAEVTVDTETGLQDGRWELWLDYHHEGKTFFFPFMRSDWFWGPPSFLSNGKQGLKQPGGQAALLTARAEFGND